MVVCEAECELVQMLMSQQVEDNSCRESLRVTEVLFVPGVCTANGNTNIKVIARGGGFFE